VFVTDSKNLYITAGGEYIPIVAANEVSIDWSNVKGNYVKLTGDTMSGDLTAPNLIAKNQLQSKTYVDAPLTVNSNIMVKNLNSEYLNGKKWDEFARRDEAEKIGGAWTFNNRETFNNTVIFNDNIGSAQFKSGFAGLGWRLSAASNTLTIDNLIVRKTMNVYELVVNKISATNGSLWVSDSGKIKSCEKMYPVQTDFMSGLQHTLDELEYNTKELIDDVDENGILTGEKVEAVGDVILDKDAYIPTLGDGNILKKRYIYDYYFRGPVYSIELEDDLTPFRVNDIVRCQQFKDNRVVYYDAVVINTNNCLYIRLYQLADPMVEGDSIMDYVDSSDTPAEGQPLVRIGNISDKNRQGAIYLTSSDEDSPFIDIMECINRPDFTTSIKCVNEETKQPYTLTARSMRIGKLDGIEDPAFGSDQPKGMGMYAENVYIKGKIIQVEEGEEYFIPIYKGEYSSSATYYYYNYVFYKNKYWLQVHPNLESVTGKAPDYVDYSFTQTDTQYNKYWQLYMAGADGQPGDNGVSSLTSYVFCRYASQPPTPTGGSWSDPTPVESAWTDGVPDGTDPLWMSYRLFFSDNRTTNNWTEPVCMSSSDAMQIKYSSTTTDPGTPDTRPGLWGDAADSSTVWMAVRKWSDQGWSEWQVSKIKGENGESGGIGYSVVLSNETHTIVVDGSGAVTMDQEITCDSSVYQLATSVKHTMTVVNDDELKAMGVTATTSQLGNTQQRLTLKISKGTVLSNFEVAMDLKITDAATVRRVMTICVVTSGKASFVTLSGDQIFVYKKEDITKAVPSSITLTANPNNCEVTNWLIRSAGGSYVSQNKTGNTFTVDPTESYWNSQTCITVKVEAGELYDEMSIVKLYDGLDGDAVEGLQGAVIRTTEWATGVNYEDGTVLENGIKYLDIVTVTSGPNDYSVYQCKLRHTSDSNNKPNSASDTTYWRKLNKQTPIYTPLIFAENAKFYMASTNELAIVDENNTVVAAMSGGNNQGYTFWSGAANPSDATFGVFLDGTLRATKAQIEGSFKVKAKNDERSIELNVDTEESTTRSTVENPNIKITDESGNLVTELNGNMYSDDELGMGDSEGDFTVLSKSDTIQVNGRDIRDMNEDHYYTVKTYDINVTEYVKHLMPLNVTTAGFVFSMNAALDGTNGAWWTGGSFNTTDFANVKMTAYLYTFSNGERVMLSSQESLESMYFYGTTSGIKQMLVQNPKTITSSSTTVNIQNAGSSAIYFYCNIYIEFSMKVRDTLLKQLDGNDNFYPFVSFNTSSMTARYVINGYTSKYFANGLTLGTRTNNCAQLYNSEDGSMMVRLMSNERGIQLDKYGLAYKGIAAVSHYMPFLSIISAISLTTSTEEVRILGIVSPVTSNTTSNTINLKNFLEGTGLLTSQLGVIITPKSTTPKATSYYLSGNFLTIYNNGMPVDVLLWMHSGRIIS
jgi:hypothetical protein